MAFLNDPDLKFLGKLNNNDLNMLHDILLYDRDACKRWTCELHKKPGYSAYAPKHSKYWTELAEELQKYGGNTVANKVRGHGVPYAEILRDVCIFLEIKFNPYVPVSEMEDLLLYEILQRALSISSLMQRREMFNFVSLHTKRFKNLSDKIFYSSEFIKNRQLIYATAKMIIIALAKKLKLPGNNYLPARLSDAVLDKLIYAIILLFNAIFTGPLILTGPAYRVTVPAVVQIAYLRKSLLCGQAGKFMPKNWHRIKNFVYLYRFNKQGALPK